MVVLASSQYSWHIWKRQRHLKCWKLVLQIVGIPHRHLFTSWHLPKQSTESRRTVTRQMQHHENVDWSLNLVQQFKYLIVNLSTCYQLEMNYRTCDYIIDWTPHFILEYLIGISKCLDTESDWMTDSVKVSCIFNVYMKKSAVWTAM